MKSREEIRDEILALKKKYLLLALPTGIGKSRIALDVTYREGSLLPKVLIVYPKLNLKKNWIDEIKKWGYERDLDNITFTTYNSLMKHAGEYWDMVIFDEGHHITERVIDIIQVMHFERSLILSATVKTSLMYKLKMVMPGLHTYRVRMKDAIDNDILPDPKIILLPLTYNVVSKTETIVKNPKIQSPVYEIPFEKRNMYRDKKNRYVIHCTEAQYATEMDSQIDWFKRQSMGGNQALKNLWLHKAGERLKWMAAKKTPYVLALLDKLKDERTLTFCASIEQTEEVGSNCVHSKNKLALSVLDKFNEGSIKHLTAVAMLDEGVNLVNCRVGIFANINASERIQIQRIGRLLRHDKPIIIFPYFKNSREEEIVEKMLIGYNPELIEKVSSVNNITL